MTPGSLVATQKTSLVGSSGLGCSAEGICDFVPTHLMNCYMSGASGVLTQVPCCAPQNKLNINDWSSVQSLFDKLNKQMEKTLKAADSLGAPRVYIKMLVELEVCCQVPYHMYLID